MSDLPYQNEPRLDLSVIEDLRALDEEGRPSVIVELGQMFLESVPTTLRNLRESFANGDTTRVRREAHSLKSAAGNLGARRFSAICSAIESGKQNIEEGLALLENEFGPLAIELGQQMKGAA